MLELISAYSGAYLAGFGISLVISLLVIALSVAIGTMAAIGRLSRRPALRRLTAIYVALFRALPPLLTLYLVYFGLPFWAASAGFPILSQLLEPLNNRIFASVVALTFTSAAYTTEIIRAGILSVRHEQLEAARSLGMTYPLAFRRVIGPQAFRVAFPPLSNEYITVLKFTSLTSVIGVAELMRAAQIAGNVTFQYLQAYALAGMYYVAFVVVLQ